MRPRNPLLIALLAALLAACGESPQAKPGADTPPAGGEPSDDQDEDEPEDEDEDEDEDGTDPVEPEWGLDARPANPTCIAPARPADPSAAVALEPAFPGLSFYRPTNLVHRPGDDSRWYITESEGQILRFEARADVTETATFLDLSADVHGQLDGSGEMGVLGLAFHPRFDDNGLVYVSYTSRNADDSLQSNVVRYQSRDGGDTADPSTAQTVMTVAQPRHNHNGGRLLFGPDGMLWLAFGDGGGNEGRDASDALDNVYGKLLRIDVDSGSPYAIPADNPSVAGVLPEAWAWGFRNPWGWSFDRATGDLWAGDVGAGAWEELMRVEKGGHYGWPCCEGPDCVTTDRYPTCLASDRVDATWAYSHDEGQVVIAGPVYHGTDIPGLDGNALVADYLAGWIKGVRLDADGAAQVQPLVQDTGLRFSGFAEDLAGEVYVLGFSGRAQIHKLVPASTDPGEPSTVPMRLSETGCFDPTDPSLPVDAMIPYGINAPFWSDGLDKERWFAIPDGTHVDVGSDGGWSLPVGSVIAKAFRSEGELVETRLLMHHEDGWAGYTWVWEGDDAVRVDTGRRLELGGGQVYAVPQTWQCLACHREEAGRTLGLETAQLDRAHPYPSTGRTSEQLLTLRHIGILAEDPPSMQPLVDPDAGTADAGRAWLHTNCAMCHRPDAPTAGALDLRWTSELADMGLCDIPPADADLGLEDARLLAPGAPERSLIALRPRRDDVWRMPPMGSLLVDEAGLAGVDAWIHSVSACPEPAGPQPSNPAP